MKILSYKIKKIDNAYCKIKFIYMHPKLRNCHYQYGDGGTKVRSTCHPAIYIEGYAPHYAIYLPGATVVADNDEVLFNKHNLKWVIETLREFVNSDYVKKRLEN